MRERLPRYLGIHLLCYPGGFYPARPDYSTKPNYFAIAGVVYKHTTPNSNSIILLSPRKVVQYAHCRCTVL